MPEPNHSPQGPNPVSTILVLLASVTTVDLNIPVIVGIARESFHTVSRDLVLKVDFRHGGSVVMRVEMLVSCDMKEFDACAGCKVGKRE